jgi:hypothetical protein
VDEPSDESELVRVVKRATASRALSSEAAGHRRRQSARAALRAEQVAPELTA